MSVVAADVTGETTSGSLRVNFDRRLKLQFQGIKLSSDGGLIVYRELDGAKAVRHARSVILQIAEVAVPRDL